MRKQGKHNRCALFQLYFPQEISAKKIFGEKKGVEEKKEKKVSWSDKKIAANFPFLSVVSVSPSSSLLRLPLERLRSKEKAESVCSCNQLLRKKAAESLKKSRLINYEPMEKENKKEGEKSVRLL